MSGGPHQRVKTCGDFRVGLQVVPIGPSECLVIRGRAGANGGEHGSPRVRHPAADTVEVQEESSSFVEENAGEIIEFESARRGIREYAFRGQMAEDPVKRIAIGSGRRGKLGDIRGARGDVIRHPEGRDDVDTPRGAEVSEFPDIHSDSMTQADMLDSMANNEPDATLRKQLAAMISGGHAHITFEDVVRDFPRHRIGQRPPGIPHSAWELLEHLRIAQNDIVEFSRSGNYESPSWPEGYWPADTAPSDSADWDRSVQQYLDDRARLVEMLSDPAHDLHAEFPWGDGQTLLREALLVLDHNSYHLGQLMLVKKSWQD